MLNIVGLSIAEDAFISMPVMFVWSVDLIAETFVGLCLVLSSFAMCYK